MESAYQDELAVAQPELSPQDQLRLQWAQQPGLIPLLRQKNVISQNAELLPHVATARLAGWITPLAFALQGLVLISAVAALANWQLTRHAGKLEEQISALQADAQAEIRRQEVLIAATQAEIARVSNSQHSAFNLRISSVPLTREQALGELNAMLADSQRGEQQYKEQVGAQERKLRARQSALAIANSGTPLIFSLALVLAAALVGNGMQKDFSRGLAARRTRDFYLYFAAAEGLWPNLILLLLLHIVLSRSAYGLSQVFSRVGPLFWVVFPVGVYLLLLHYFAVVSRGISQALMIARPANEWSPENRVLLRVHNSFLLVFAGMETGFLAVCYAIYLVQRHLS